MKLAAILFPVVVSTLSMTACTGPGASSRSSSIASSPSVAQAEGTPSTILPELLGDDVVKGDGTIREEPRQVEAFRKLELSGALSLDMTQGPSTSVVVETDANLLPYVRTESQGDTLRIYTEEDLRPSKSILVHLTTPTIESLEVSGACLVATGPLRTSKFTTKLTGASELSIQSLVAQQWDLTLHGSSKVSVLGGEKMRRVMLQSTGASNASLARLAIENMSLTLTGASRATVNVTSQMDGTVEGASSVEYQPSQAKILVEQSGVSSVNPAAR